MFSRKRLYKSFCDAGRGLRDVFKSEQNFRLQVFAAAVVVVLLIVLPLHNWERIVLILLMVMVLSMELLNSAMERLSDMLKPRLSPYIRMIKDIMAAAVLVTSLGALTVGILICWPYLVSFLK